MFDLALHYRPRTLCVFIPNSCPGPTATQRSSAANYWSRVGERAPMALLTESRLLRGMLTAMQWLTKHAATPYSPKGLELAFDEIDVKKETRGQLRAEAFGMAKHLGVAVELAYLDPGTDTRSLAV
jgi:hypothetical protein